MKLTEVSIETRGEHTESFIKLRVRAAEHPAHPTATNAIYKRFLRRPCILTDAVSTNKTAAMVVRSHVCCCNLQSIEFPVVSLKVACAPSNKVHILAPRDAQYLCFVCTTVSLLLPHTKLIPQPQTEDFVGSLPARADASIAYDVCAFETS